MCAVNLTLEVFVVNVKELSVYLPVFFHPFSFISSSDYVFGKKT